MGLNPHFAVSPAWWKQNGHLGTLDNARFVGVRSPQYLYPTQNGVVTEWDTGTPLDVDDPQPQANNDGDTTIIQVSPPASMARDQLYLHTPFLPMLPIGAVISQVRLYAVCRRVSGSSGSIRDRWYIGGGFYGGILMISMLAPATNWLFGQATRAVNPATGLAWTRDDLNNSQFGIRLNSDGSGSYRSTQIYVEVTYA